MAHFGVEVRGSWYRGIINTLIMVHFGVEVSTWQLVQRNNKHNNNGTFWGGSTWHLVQRNNKHNNNGTFWGGSTWHLEQRNNKHNNNGTHLQCLWNGPRCFTTKDK